LQAFALTVAILLTVTLSNKFVNLLVKSARGDMPIMLVMKVILLYLPNLFTLMAPVALFISILITHSKMHANGELTVLLSTGYSWRQLLKLTSYQALAVSFMVGLGSLQINAQIEDLRDYILQKNQVEAFVQAIIPGQFVSAGGKYVIYVEDVLENNNLKNIFIAQQPARLHQADNDLIMVAKKASIKSQARGSEVFVKLISGQRIQGRAGSANLQVVSFKEYGKSINSAIDLQPKKAKGTYELLFSRKAEDKAELHWRLALPLVAYIMALIAIPLAYVGPRQSRAHRIFPGILVFIAYYNLLILAKRLITTSAYPAFVGMWWVHLLFIAIFYTLYYQLTKNSNKAVCAHPN